MNDGDLLRLYVRERSETAFRELVGRQVNLVYSAALRQTRGRSDLAQDVTQLVFTELARKAPLLVRHPSLRGWLLVCTRHIAARAVRTEMRRTGRESAAQLMNEITHAPAPGDESLGPVLDDVLLELSDREREAVFLRFFDKLTFAEVGQRLGVSEDASRRRIERALERMRRLLSRRGITSTAAALAVVLTAETVKAAPADVAGRSVQAALAGATVSPSGLLVAFAFMKSIAVSTSFIAALALAGLLAGGAGLYVSRQLSHEEAAAVSATNKIARAEAQLNRIKQTSRALTPKPATAARSLDEQVASDLTVARWKEQRMLAFIVLNYWPLLKRHHVSVEQFEACLAVARTAYSKMDDLAEVAKLAGVSVGSDPGLQAQEQQIKAQYISGVTGILGQDAVNTVDAYSASMNDPNQNRRQLGEAQWVSQQVAGTAFAQGTPLTADQRIQTMQLLLQNTPSYSPGQSTDAWTIDWDGVVAQAQKMSVAPSELAALQSFRANVMNWELNQQAAQAAQGSTP